MVNRRWMIPVLSLVTALVAFGGFWWLVRNDTLNFRQNKTEAKVIYAKTQEAIINKPVIITVTINSGYKNVNAVGLYMRFDPAYLQLTDMNTQASFCQFYPEKKFDNQLGTISLSCGAPHPGFKGETTLMTLTFLPKQPGQTMLYTQDTSQVLASDGKGTNILTEYPQQEITIFNNL